MSMSETVDERKKDPRGWRHYEESNDTTPGDNALNQRPKLGQWLRLTLPDILTMLVMSAIGLAVYQAPLAPSRSFPIFFQDGAIVYPEFAYPLRREIIPTWMDGAIAILVPIAIILLMQFRIRSFWDTNNAIIGLIYSILTGSIFQVFLKCLIGGLRPHFLAVCKPSVTTDGLQDGNGFGDIMYNPTICTGNKAEIKYALQSFPSGHTVTAFGGFVFLYLYLNAKLKVWSNYHPAYWKLIVTYMPILGATLIGGALTIDEYHNWYDIVAGGIIGTIMAFSSYRMVYASVWDFRFNHIPLLRHLAFKYGDAQIGFGGLEDAIWTREAGWGKHESGALGGAPFDMARGPPLNDAASSPTETIDEQARRNSAHQDAVPANETGTQMV